MKGEVSSLLDKRKGRGPPSTRIAKALALRLQRLITVFRHSYPLTNTDLNQQTEVTARLYTVTLQVDCRESPHPQKGAVTALLTSHMLSEFLSTGPEPIEETPLSQGT